MPAPLVPAEVDLRGMPWMPLDTVRLIDSDLFALSTGDEFKAAVALWCKSWAQVPAASLPCDDRILAHLCGAGARWKKVKELALRGWVLCDDGRLYHPVIAEKAMEAWEQREEYQDRQDNERTRLQQFRAEHKALRKKLREHGIVLPFDTKIDVLRERVASLPETSPETKTETEPETLPETKAFQDRNACNAPAMAKTGTGTGTGTKDQEQKRTEASQNATGAPVDDDPPSPPTAAGLACRLMRQAGCVHTSPQNPDLLAALQLGATPEQLGQLAAQAVTAGKRQPFGWAVATALRRLQDGEPVIPTEIPHADRQPSGRGSAVERVRAANERAERSEDASLRPIQGTVRVLPG